MGVGEAPAAGEAAASVPAPAAAAPRRWSDAAWPAATAVLFVVCLACNASAGGDNAAVSAAHRTAFTPAGYAFAIWGLIYTLGVCAVAWQAAPARWRWEAGRGRCGLPPARALLCANFAANALWIFAFTRGWGGSLWLSTAIIFLGILAPLLALHARLRVGQGAHAGAPPVTFSELVAVHGFVSLYAGWVCVACIANVALSATPEGGGPPPALAGLDASSWSIIMMCVATVVALAMLLRFRDAVFAAPISWALFAIAVQQQSDDYPGDARVVLAARLLGAAVAVAALAAAALRVAACVTDRTRFAPEVVRLPCCARPLHVPSIGWVEDIAAAPTGDAVASLLNPAHGVIPGM